MKSISTIFTTHGLLLLLLLLPATSATVILPEYHNRKFESQPALFGTAFALGAEYDARLQVVPDDPYLCGADDDGTNDNGEDDLGFEMMVLRNEVNNTITVPKDGKPVALLAKRGKCSFESKARFAMNQVSPPDIVKYVIVYDDSEQASLVPMSAGNPRGIHVGLLFVSYRSGTDLLSKIKNQASTSLHAGGIQLLLDSKSPWIPFVNEDSQEWMLAFIVGLFLFLSCFGCVFLCIHSGFVRMDGNVIIVGGFNFDDEAEPHRRLLTRSDVLKLPEVEYHTSRVDNLDDDEHDTSHLEINSIRDGGKQHHRQPNAVASTAQQHASLSSSASFDYFENTSCPVCLEDYANGEKLRMLPCKHCFHTNCILPWLTERQAYCPLCKVDVECADDDDGTDTQVLSLREEDDNGGICAWLSRSRLCRWCWCWSGRDSSGNIETIQEEETSLMHAPLLRDQRSPSLVSI